MNSLFAQEKFVRYCYALVDGSCNKVHNGEQSQSQRVCLSDTGIDLHADTQGDIARLHYSIRSASSDIQNNNAVRFSIPNRLASCSFGCPR